ncbi:MAG: hypothetical protein JWO77_1501 [Ilumatobacteraceae bacterium]|nr:hypothetical protein [Ilumatobacteraceae bacterium]
MSDADPVPEPKRRTVTPHRVAVGVMAAIVLVGAALLLLPYSTEIDVSLGSSGFFVAEGPVEGRCEPPLLDAIHGESSDWLNYAPGEDGFQQDGLLTGSWCSPESLQRGAIGAGTIVFGMCGLLTLEIVRQRRLRLARTEALADGGPDPEADPPPAT